MKEIEKAMGTPIMPIKGTSKKVNAILKNGSWIDNLLTSKEFPREILLFA